MSDTTYDNSSNANDMEAEDGFASSMLTFAAIMTLLIMVVGIFGNFLTVAALIKCPKVRNVAAAFIMSLCIADLLFCALVLPFNAYRFIEGTWEPRDVLCKMIPFIQYGNIGVSLLCIAMITINRYVMIAHHSSYGKIYKRHWIAAMIIFCWVFSYGMQLPTLVGAWGTFGYDKKLGTCSILEDDHGHSSKTTLFVTAFVIPCIIIIACYTKIFWVVHKSEQRLKRHANKQNSIPNNLRTTPVATGSNVETGNGQSRVSSADSSSFSTDVKHESVQKQTTRVKDQREVRAKRNEWRITKMVLAIFLSFVICYLPITIAKVADQDVEHPNFHILSYIMLYMSACINPIIYVIMNKQYRKAYKTVIMCQPGRLLPFGKHAGGGGNNGSSVAEKWKDTGLNRMSHSRTMVSAVDQQNTSFSSSVQLPAMELSSKPNETKTKDTIESIPVTLQAAESTSTPTSIENASKPETQNTEELVVAPSKNEQMPIPTPVQSHSKNTNITNNNNNQNEQVNLSTNIITPRTIKRIALVGGDIILEEEEEEEEEQEPAARQMIENQSCEEKKNEQTIMPTSTPPPPSTVSQRPTPVYVNASVLHQKKNPSYGQNINVIPDNKNSTKLLTKPKL
ncbi:G-protein coupled receptor moody isoform X1 [Lucilia cuprina]|uniref:G-protein coupled receptor moody isoform X1 n=2 Tax=Lucilia cuprina TaxID=7375 RepID=UPI001F0515EB|nr:G-protein coupled receptor moody isoform X1 [Lucilia cuprina]XP_046802142.1 G-protein coupled receptor moody isoform X1 [Lucilia cuprina]XP_046802143.1 G-protein coupled receptor moody isoform X1 [Lucilia cuprina]XP_046802144.1 G-protein coupled receptor moody isoform X1 [Lucilia cuprina]XP_046802145.1 G-protein coupled receptor moody isoform X1 [Lucilia cuprina]XP_046802146.1 G-protein coupled receptor moody isoform X1 [Lucilia cuprina]